MLCHFFFSFNDTATTEIYTLSLHDALPISYRWQTSDFEQIAVTQCRLENEAAREANRLLICDTDALARSEEHTSELQSRRDLVCRLLLEKKKNTKNIKYTQLNQFYN